MNISYNKPISNNTDTIPIVILRTQTQTLNVEVVEFCAIYFYNNRKLFESFIFYLNKIWHELFSTSVYIYIFKQQNRNKMYHKYYTILQTRIYMVHLSTITTQKYKHQATPISMKRKI